MPFREGNQFWRLLGREAEKFFLEDARIDAEDAATANAAVRNKVNTYHLSGPLGSQDPRVPVNVKKLHAELNDPESSLKEQWGKKNILTWSRSLNSCAPNKCFTLIINFFLVAHVY